MIFTWIKLVISFYQFKVWQLNWQWKLSEEYFQKFLSLCRLMVSITRHVSSRFFIERIANRRKSLSKQNTRFYTEMFAVSSDRHVSVEKEQSLCSRWERPLSKSACSHAKLYVVTHKTAVTLVRWDKSAVTSCGTMCVTTK